MCPRGALWCNVVNPTRARHCRRPDDDDVTRRCQKALHLEQGLRESDEAWHMDLRTDDEDALAQQYFCVQTWS